MTDHGPILVDPALSEAIEAQIQSRSLGLIQTELGVVQSNVFMLQARIEALMAQRVLDLQHIEALTIRVKNADENVRILQDQNRAAQATIKKFEKPSSRRRKTQSEMPS